MRTVILEPRTDRGHDLIANHGDEWLIIEDRGSVVVATDLDEEHRMVLPNPHVTITEEPECTS